MPKTTMTTGGGPARTRVIRWTATDAAPRKRWWWYLAVVLVTAWVTCFLVLLQQWTAVAVAVGVPITFFVVYRGQSRSASFSLGVRKLTIDDKVYLLEDFRAYRIVGTGEQERILLIPRRYFRLAIYLVPNGDPDFDDQIVERLSRQLTYEDARDLLERLARWLRLG